MSPGVALAALGVGLVMSVIATWCGMRLAPRIGLVAPPREDRWHRHPTPMLGGLGLLAGFLAGWAVAAGATPIPGRLLGCLMGGVAIAFAVGLADDLRPLGLPVKLAGQLAAAVLVTAGGLGFGDPLPAGADWCLTVLLLLAVMNAVNLLDNMDGVSAGVMCVAFLGLVGVTTVAGAGGAAALLPGVAAGACAGYLVWNLPLPRARVFMGDGGSLPLGLTIGALTLLASQASASGGEATRLLPFIVLFVPALDSAVVTISRRRSGLHVYLGGKDHLAHRLVGSGLSERKALGVLVAGAAAAAGLATAAAALPWTASMLAIAGLVVALFVLLIGRLVGSGGETSSQTRFPDVRSYQDGSESEASEQHPRVPSLDAAS